MNAEFYIFVSFVLFCLLSYKHIKNTLGRFIDSKIDSIKRKISEVESIRLNAEAHLSYTLAEHQKTSTKCDAILKATQSKIDDLRKESEKKLYLMEERKKSVIKKSIEHQIEVESRKLRNALILRLIAEVESDIVANRSILDDVNSQEAKNFLRIFSRTH